MPPGDPTDDAGAEAFALPEKGAARQGLLNAAVSGADDLFAASDPGNATADSLRAQLRAAARPMLSDQVPNLHHLLELVESSCSCIFNSHVATVSGDLVMRGICMLRLLGSSEGASPHRSRYTVCITYIDSRIMSVCDRLRRRRLPMTAPAKSLGMLFGHKLQNGMKGIAFVHASACSAAEKQLAEKGP